MKKARCFILIATHVAALCAGLLFWRSPSNPQKALEVAGRSKTSALEGGKAPFAPGPSRPKSVAEALAKPSVHKSAWMALAYEGLPRPERMKASALVLKGWIREDWRAALDTVMRETPDDFDLLDEFQDTFVREPEAVWQLIEEKRYGVLTKSVRDRWMTAIGRQDTTTLRALIDRLPASGKLATSDLLARSSRNRP